MKRDKFTLAIVGVIFIGILCIALYKADRDHKAIMYTYPNVETETEAPTQEETQPDILERVAQYAKQATTPTIEVITIETVATTTETETEVGAQMSLPPQTTETPTEPQTTTVVEIITEAPTEPPMPVVVSNTKVFTAEEENLLVRVASLEAGNQGWIGMALVMNVVLNRSATYNISIKDVILAPRQFSVVGCEKWNSGYTAPEALTALQAVKDGWDGSQGALFFCSPRANSWHNANLTYLFTGYGHEFYR